MRQPGVKRKVNEPNPQELRWVTEFEAGLARSMRRLGLARRAVLTAVSGGPDSMTVLSGLARIAGRLGLTLHAATVDHALRPASAAEAAAVSAWAARHGVPHVVLPGPVAPGAGVEARAREARYAALHEAKRALGCDVIATGHTANDQAETVLMRLSRGASLRGAAGVRSQRADGVVRPLLFATRAEVERYVRALGLPVVRDEMNDDEALLRTRVRQQAVPALEAAAGPGTVQALARFAELAAEDDAWLAATAAAALERLRAPGCGLDVVGLLALAPPIARRAAGQWLEGQGVPLDAALVDEVLAAARESRATPLPGDRGLRVADGCLRVEPAPPRRLH